MRGPQDCYKKLRGHFATEAWEEQHKNERYEIKKIEIHWTGENDIQRPFHYERQGDDYVLKKTKNKTEVSPLTGATTNYSFIVLGYETLGVRGIRAGTGHVWTEPPAPRGAVRRWRVLPRGYDRRFAGK